MSPLIPQDHGVSPFVYLSSYLIYAYAPLLQNLLTNILLKNFMFYLWEATAGEYRTVAAKKNQEVLIRK